MNATKPVWRTRIGAIEVFRVEEMLGPGFDPAFLFPAYDKAVLAQHPMLAEPAYFDAATGRLMSSMQSWLVRTGAEIIIIDTGCGNGKTRSHPAFRRFHQLDLPYLANLVACGVRPEEVTMVINTHLHVDHVGWNTRLEGGRWVPTFPRARYLMARAELAHWQNPEGGPRMQPEGVEAIADSVLPLLDQARVELFDPGDEIAAGVTIEAAPGHTPSQIAVRVASGAADGLFTADVFHQPMQIVRPDWNSRYCELPDLAIATRRRVLGEAADAGSVLFPSHTGAPHAGRIGRGANGFHFIPLAMTEA
ncbi:MAG: MBL fold metallo-hydrolase [Rhodospirillales bacterium]|nr:MBL fold metallo-hydrolase [Rhodospirillales bacterium]MDE2577070.1 MBL fold metallo-hydrolase [Rhodospirillales bacterium]